MLDMRNPFIFAPIKLGYGDGSGMITDRHLEFYDERSRYLGAITVEPLYLDRGLREIPTQIGIDEDDKLDGLRKLTEVIHKAGAKAIAHLNHPGRMANPKIPGNYFVSSTARPCENGGATPVKMDRQEMEKALGLFVEAARRAERAGFDFIELQFGHGYLLAQFLSPAVNDRSDEYGGSLANRVRFPLQVLKAVKSAVGIPIIARISGDEMIPDGIKLPEMIEFSGMLKDAGVAAIHVTAGSVCSTPPWFFQHMFIPKGKTWEMAAAIRKAVHIPVIFVGRINSPDDVDRLKKQYRADYIALGRALIADPDFVGKYTGQVPGIIRPCLACSEGCLGGVKGGRGLHCVVNPFVGTGHKAPEKAPAPKKFAIVGGGLAGMQAAITLRERGHRVVLYEKKELGGQFNLASLPPNKESLRLIVDYFKDELNRKSVEIIRREAKADELLSGGFDGVILATGAVPTIPPIKGLTKYYWTEFLLDENLPQKKRILIIGGGLIGMEMASKLVEKDNEVIIVEMLDEVAGGMEMIEKALTMKKLKQREVTIYTGYQVSEVQGNTVYLSGKDQKKLEGIDEIVVAAGMKSYNPLEKELKGKIPCWVVGDARQVGKAQDAIRSAFEVAKEL